MVKQPPATGITLGMPESYLKGSHGSSSLPVVRKVMVCRFVSDSHEVTTALIVMYPLIVVVEISLQLHPSFV
jgi:hypothetical protein